MRYQTHILTSVTAGVALVHGTSIDPSVGFFVGLIAGSLLPDVDEPNSYIGKRTSVKVLNSRFGFSSMVKGIFGHRGFTHSLLAALIMFIPYFVFGSTTESIFVQNILFGLGFGYLFHILGDMLSKSGVPLFMPFTDQRIKIPLYVTGKFSEKIIFVISSVLLVYLFHQEFLQQIVDLAGGK